MALDVRTCRFCCRQNLVIIVTRKLQVNGRAYRRTCGILVYGNHRARESFHVGTQIVQNDGAQHLVSVFVHAKGRFPECHNDFGFVRCFLRCVAGTGVAGTCPHLGNDGLHHVVVPCSLLVVGIFINHLQHPVFNFLGQGIGFLDVRPNGHFNINVSQIGLVGRKKDHFGRKGRQKDHTGHQQSDGAVVHLIYIFCAQGIPHNAAVKLLQLGQVGFAEPLGGLVQPQYIQGRQTAAVKQQVAYRVQGGCRRAFQGIPGHVQRQANSRRQQAALGPLFHIDLLLFDLHVARCQRRIDHQGHKQRRRQHNHQRNGQVLHELANQTRPNGQRQKGRNRCGGGGNNRNGNFSGAFAGCGLEVKAHIRVPVDVFNYHNPIVYQHPQSKHQGKQDHGIQGHAHGSQNEEAQQHGERNGNPYKEGIAQSQKEHQHQDHQQNPKQDGVLQLAQLVAGAVGLVVGDRYLNVVRQGVRSGVGKD